MNMTAIELLKLSSYEMLIIVLDDRFQNCEDDTIKSGFFFSFNSPCF